MKSAQEILSKYHYERGNPEIDYDLLVTIINDAKIDALNTACNLVKTYKVGNGGSWMDAGVDKTPIIELIKTCQTND